MKPFRSIIAICLAVLILVVTTGFNVSQHFCQGELLDFAIFGQTEPCEMEMSKNDLPPCHAPDKPDKPADAFSEKPCCEDHHAAVEGQDTPTVRKDGDNLLPSIEFLAAFTYTLFQYHLPSTEKDTLLAEYRSPLIQRDIPVFNQSFLI